MAIIVIPELDLIGDTDAGTIARGEDESLTLWSDLVCWVADRAPMSSAAIGRHVGAATRTVQRWKEGKYPPGPPARRLLLGLAREILLRREGS